MCQTEERRALCTRRLHTLVYSGTARSKKRRSESGEEEKEGVKGEKLSNPFGARILTAISEPPVTAAAASAAAVLSKEGKTVLKRVVREKGESDAMTCEELGHQAVLRPGAPAER